MPLWIVTICPWLTNLNRVGLEFIREGIERYRHVLHLRKNKFMKSIVNPQPFTSYPRLLQMLEQAEHMFEEIRTTYDLVLKTERRALDGWEGCQRILRSVSMPKYDRHQASQPLSSSPEILRSC